MFQRHRKPPDLSRRWNPAPKSMLGRPQMPEDLPSVTSENCAMTSRTNRDSEGQNHRGKTPTLPSALARRRQEVLERYLAGDRIEVICREMGCSKSWLYKWKHRSQVTEPDWFQEHPRRPETTPTKTPDALEAQIVGLRHTLSPHGSGTVSAGVIRDHLRQYGAKSIPSRRTIYRILKRQAKEVNSHACTS